MTKEASNSPGRTLTTEISADNKKAIWTFTVNPNETLQSNISISYLLGLRKPIANELVLKATLKQGGVEIDDGGSNVILIAKDPNSADGQTHLGAIFVNKDPITIQSDALKDKELLVFYPDSVLGTTNTADAVFTLEITN